MSLLSTLAEYILTILQAWISLIVAPIKDTNMLWVVIPIYLTWIFTEFFQEKKGTSLGNATSNSVVVLWAAIDWSRTSVNLFKDSLITIWNLIFKIFLSLVIICYGIIIVMEGMKGKSITMVIGRIRVVTYIVLMMTPLVYGTVNWSLTVIIAAVIIFPVFYYFVELIDKYTPDPKPIIESKEDDL
jgi:hypothetical protein